MLECGGHGKHYGTRSTTPGSLRGKWQHSWPTTQLLCGENGLLHLRAVQEPKLGLDHSKPVIGLERLSRLGEERRVSGRKVAVGSWS
jgi:hypothetical protein